MATRRNFEKMVEIRRTSIHTVDEVVTVPSRQFDPF